MKLTIFTMKSRWTVKGTASVCRSHEQDYAAKVWTTLERRSPQARAINQPGRVYILPARFDDTEIPGLLPTVGYIDLRQTTPPQLANMILQKIGRGAP